MPDYRITISIKNRAPAEAPTQERLVRARNEARALAHVVKDSIEIERADTDDVIRLTQAGVNMEHAE